jgi:diadenosine tetraphosphate (Ap4A) HIT family hydrolase
MTGPLCIAIEDGYPVSRGHSLIVPRRHTHSFFELSQLEEAAILAMVRQTKTVLDIKYAPEGYNLGINDGAAAGQTIMHVHLHVIPRYRGDRRDPRGGIRWIFPEKADYWSNKS